MTPIELNGKVFCSNCGLTVANNAPTVAPVVNTINPIGATVSDLETNAPDEIAFPVIPEVVANEETSLDNSALLSNPEEIEEPIVQTPLNDPFGQFTDSQDVQTVENMGVKVPVMTEPSKPITEQIAKDLGISEVAPIEALAAEIPEPVLESKIADLTIPSEEDFSSAAPAELPEVSSYVELANHGDEKATLEASGILLDILGEQEKEMPDVNPSESRHSEPSEESRITDPGSFVPTQDDKSVTEKPLNPVLEPEIPKETETLEKDDIYTLPADIQKGFKLKKKPKVKATVAAVTPSEVAIDLKTEKKIEKIEEEIENLPEPTVDITPEEATAYDPDTIDVKDIHPAAEKSAVIKDYFKTSLEKDKKANKAKAKKNNKNSSKKIVLITLAAIFAVIVLASAGYFGYKYINKPVVTVQAADKDAPFDVVSPSYIPEGYSLSKSEYQDASKTAETVYVFDNDETKTITIKQVLVDDPKKYTQDYLLKSGAVYIEKEVNGTVVTEIDKTNLLWTDGEFVFIIETNGYTFSNDLLYKLAEAVKL